MGKVSLTIARLKAGLIPTQRTNYFSVVGMKKSESIASDCKTASRHVARSKFCSTAHVLLFITHTHTLVVLQLTLLVVVVLQLTH